MAHMGHDKPRSNSLFPAASSYTQIIHVLLAAKQSFTEVSRLTHLRYFFANKGFCSRAPRNYSRELGRPRNGILGPKEHQIDNVQIHSAAVLALLCNRCVCVCHWKISLIPKQVLCVIGAFTEKYLHRRPNCTK